jgi:hypothetical protein
MIIIDLPTWMLMGLSVIWGLFILSLTFVLIVHGLNKYETYRR